MTLCRLNKFIICLPHILSFAASASFRTFRSRNHTFSFLTNINNLEYLKGKSLYSTTRDEMARPRVFFDVTLDDTPAGRIVFELFSDVVPKTAENFRKLCTGEQAHASVKLHYKNSIFHRVIPGFMCQGGDITNHNGTGGLSIYGQRFDDENFKAKHDKPGLLSMANSGPNTNGSQFFITTVPCPWLDGKHTVFGEVVEGFEVVKKVEAEGSSSGKTRKVVKVSDCGQL